LVDGAVGEEHGMGREDLVALGLGDRVEVRACRRVEEPITVDRIGRRLREGDGREGKERDADAPPQFRQPDASPFLPRATPIACMPPPCGPSRPPPGRHANLTRAYAIVIVPSVPRRRYLFVFPEGSGD